MPWYYTLSSYYAMTNQMLVLKDYCLEKQKQNKQKQEQIKTKNKPKNKQKQKRNKTKRNETKQNKTKQNKTKNIIKHRWLVSYNCTIQKMIDPCD